MKKIIVFLLLSVFTLPLLFACDEAEEISETVSKEVSEEISTETSAEISKEVSAEISAEISVEVSQEASSGGCDDVSEESFDIVVPEKPVIYLYPETETEVSVKLNLNGKFTCTYPKYYDGWVVTAQPDGTLTDRSGQTYNYLYWEGITCNDWDMTKGFCIKGEDTAAFLEDALARLGLTRREANEFIVYWLPLMHENPYNIITFRAEEYTDSAALDISPAPDTLIRVFMTYKASDTFVEVEEQALTAPERIGFTAVEWGGAEIEQ